MENEMKKKDIKRQIKRHLKKGTFVALRTSKENIGITLYHLKQNPAYYLERRAEGLLIFDLTLNHLTLMVEK
jgi:hypothetical protein